MIVIILLIILALVLVTSNGCNKKEHYADILRDNSLKKMRQWDKNHSNIDSNDSYYRVIDGQQKFFNVEGPILAYPNDIQKRC